MNIHYFASVREKLGTDNEVLHQHFTDVTELIEFLSQRGQVWHQQLNSEQTLIAVNHTMADRNTQLTADSEVAFFPFMTGG